MAFDTLVDHARQILIRLATISSLLLGLPSTTAFASWEEESARAMTEELPATTTDPSRVDGATLQSAYQELESAQKICNIADELEPTLGMTYLTTLSVVLSHYEQTKSLPGLV